MDISACTVSPWQEAMGLITEGGLSGEFISNAFYGENNVCKITGQGGVKVKHSIALTMFTYNSRLIGEGGSQLGPPIS